METRKVRRLLKRLTREEMDRQDVADSRAALRQAEEKGTVPLEEARKRLGVGPGGLKPAAG